MDRAPTLRVATAQMRYKGTEREVVLDTTVKSSTGFARALAPTWELVMESKNGVLFWDEYVALYTALLRRRYKEDPTPFMSVFATSEMAPKIKKQTTVVFKCYCATPEHCHRSVLVDVFEKIAISKGWEFVYEGERT